MYRLEFRNPISFLFMDIWCAVAREVFPPNTSVITDGNMINSQRLADEEYKIRETALLRGSPTGSLAYRCDSLP